MTNLTDFIQTELVPRMFAQADSLFPELGLQQWHGGWRCARKLDGSPSRRPDKCVITRKMPGRILEQGGGSVSLLDLWLTQAVGTTDLRSDRGREAFRDLCRRLGLEAPSSADDSKWQAWRQAQEALEQAATRITEALYLPGGEAVLGALRGRNFEAGQRGFPDDFIRWAGIGWMSPSITDGLKDVLGSDRGFQAYRHARQPYFAIPYRSGGRVLGFTFRCILSHEACREQSVPKVINSFLSQSANKRANLFGLRGLSLTGDREEDYKALVVEGEIDALRAEWAGCGNVMAMTGGTLSQEAVNGAKSKGIKALVMLFDTEADEASQAVTDKKLSEALCAAIAGGMDVYVSWLPKVAGNGLKIDVDAFLRTASPEQLRKTIADNTIRASRWLLERAMRPYDGVAIDDPRFGECRRKALEVCRLFASSAVDRESLYRIFSECTGGYLSDRALAEDTEALLAERRKAQTAAKIKALGSEIERLGEAADIAAALDKAKDLGELADESREEYYRPTLAPLTMEQVRDALRDKPQGIRAGYYLDRPVHEAGGTRYVRDNDTEIVLPSSALTIVAAPTSHGKTTFLQNLALRTVQGSDKGSAVFITYEEPPEDVATEFLCLYAGEEYSANPVRTIRSHLADGASEMFRGDSHAKEEAAARLTAKAAEFDSLLSSGRLRILQRTPEVGDLVGLIRFLERNLDVRGVFVDYVQRLRKQGHRGSRKEELQIICDELMKVSVETGLPIVLGAQVNRECPSPVEMSNQDLADASDIEHAANTVLLLWNSSHLPHHRRSQAYTVDGSPSSPKARELAERGLELGKEGQVYVLMSKNRGGARGMDGVFSFNGRTRRITSRLPANSKQNSPNHIF